MLVLINFEVLFGFQLKVAAAHFNDMILPFLRWAVYS